MMLEEFINTGKTTELFKKLEKNKDNKEIAITLIEEIERRLNEQEYKFTNMDTKYIYTYMLVANKFEHTSYLEKLINDKKFLKVLDKTQIDGAILPSLTYNCSKPRTTLLKESNIFRKSILEDNSILNIKDILDDLTKEEIKILREDLRIDNYLINKGLSFDTIKPETEKLIIEDINYLSIYNIEKIADFTNNTKYIKDLAINQNFIKMYLEKINDDYSIEHKIFKTLTKKQILEILSSNNKEHIILNIIKNSTSSIQKELIEKKNINKLIEKCNNEYIISSLPTTKIIELYSKRSNLFIGNNLKVLENLSLESLQKIATLNPNYYSELKAKLSSGTDLDYSLFIRALDKNKLQEITDIELPKLNIKSITYLLKANYKQFKSAIINNSELCTKITNELTIRTYYKLEDLFNYGKFTIDEKTALIKNSINIKDNKVLNKMLESIPTSNRKSIYENTNIRTKLLNDNTYELDGYTIKHLLNNVDELKTLSPNIIVSIIKNSDAEFAKKLFNDKVVLEKVFKDKNPYTISNIIEILKAEKELLPIFTNKETIKYYTKENLHEILKFLTYEERVEVCSKDVINHLLDNKEEYLSLYKKLQTNNRYLLNTLDFRIFNDFILDVKFSIIEEIVKHKTIQDSLIKLNNHIPLKSNFINNLFSTEEDLSLDILNECLLIVAESCEGINRKITGNISKMLKLLDLEYISRVEIKELITYILYIIPRYYKYEEKVTRPIKVDIPNTFNELKNYEKLVEDTLTSMMHKNQTKEVVRYFIEKHFKLSYDEATMMLNKYSISRIDDTIYKEEYEYLNNLNKIYNTDIASLLEMDSCYKIYTMYESFTIENKIKNMYGKIYNFELRNKNYLTKAITKNIFGKELKIYECPNDFMFLISDIDLSEELTKTNSYFESWHNTLNKQNELKANIIANDNLIIKDNIIFGFNGVFDEGIKKISPYNIVINYNSTLKEKYMTPRELIDNTRDTNNTIILDKYAIRPNYNNSNIPNIEPDFVLVDGQNLENKTYLELISRISSEFKNKRNKNGLPIIAINIDKISNNEVSKINTNINKYQKNHDMNLLASIVTKLENNYSSYSTNSSEINKFNINELLEIVKTRILNSNSNSELSYIENIFVEESQKYQNTSKEQKCNFDLKEIKELINNRKKLLNK